MKNKLGTLCVLLACGMSVSISARAQETKGADQNKQAVPGNVDVNRNDRVTDPLQNPANDLNRNNQIPRDRVRDPLNRDPLPGDGINRPANALPRTFEGRVTAKTADTIVVNGKTYRLNKQTRFDRNGSLETVKVGDTIHGYLRGDGSLNSDLTVSALGTGALRDRRPVRDPLSPEPLDRTLPNRDRLDPTTPRTIPESPAAPGSPVQPGGPAIPRSPAQSSPTVPSAPGTPAAPSPGAPK
ncbi:MAG TPA: DUF5666 domain-containing protein [Verrucomicrobiae bacterium]|nr:DUF5666 domain-containing protein [Verrucomicrobiae bacterium]